MTNGNGWSFRAVISVSTSIIAIILGLFFHAAWSTASQGSEQAARNSIKIATIEECLRNMNSNVIEIKEILKERYK